MEITVHGAAGDEVTGSAYLVRTSSATVLVDCGMFQGARRIENSNRLPARGAFAALDAVVLTHAHLDHTGRLPLLTKLGYGGPIRATPATIGLTKLILRDSARLQEAEVDRADRARRQPGRAVAEPLYSIADVEAVERRLQPIGYDRPTEIAPGVVVRLVEAGHILGSASIEMTVTEDGRRKVVVFSGDLGPRGAPLHKDPSPFTAADMVFLESTYGDRDHPPLSGTIARAREIVSGAVAAKGKVLVPAFAIGRTQLLLYMLGAAFRRGTLPRFPVYVDSPMAIEATKIYSRHVELFDEEALALQRSGELRKSLRTVSYCSTAAQSRALNDAPGPCLIMAGAGMCTGGRILHHLLHGLAKESTTVMIVGFQSRGSLGRALVEGARSVSVLGRRVSVRAKVATVNGLSGHAGRTDLLDWFARMARSRPRVVLTHGEKEQRAALAREIAKRHRITAERPGLRETIRL
jgi:metallo-beta-lactamase family protein